MNPSIKNRLGKVQVIIIVFMWLLIFLMPVLTINFDYEINWEHIFSIWKEYAIVFIMFLINRYILLPFLLFKHKKLIYGVVFGLMIAGFISVIYLSERVGFKKEPKGYDFQPPRKESFMFKPDFEPKKEIKPPHDFIMVFPPFGNLLIMSLLILGFDTGLVFSNKWMKAEKNKAILEKENVENKMAFLRNQISPHFFMNTLNNIHALVDISVDEAKESIIRLSRMMSYMLYDSQSKYVSLHKEFDFIKSYVDLMRLRYTEQVSINLDIPDQVPNVKIPPLLTISFIENAFKHGISYEEQSFIGIQFSIDNNRMNFEVKNKIIKGKTNSENSGVGLTNSKNRLDLIFGNRYELHVDETVDNHFVVKLNIPI